MDRNPFIQTGVLVALSFILFQVGLMRNLIQSDEYEKELAYYSSKVLTTTNP